MPLIVLLFVSFAFGVIGWILNILDLLAAWHSVVTAEIALRLIGVFVVPLGSVLGWFA